MKNMKRYCMTLFSLALCVSVQGQQNVLSSGSRFSSGNISGTISVGEVFVNTNQPSSGLLFYSGVTDPASEVITSNVTIENELVHIYYEAFSESVYVKLNTGRADRDICEVYSLNGYLVRKVLLGEQEDRISLNGLPSGVYILKLIVDKKSVVYKLLKNN